ncbi:MAG: M56 family metallopeptidase [Rhodanobacter sp.]
MTLPAPLFRLLWHSLLYISFGMAMVLLLRQPARRAFGAGPAFTLWLLPALLASLPWLPATPAIWSPLRAVSVWSDATMFVVSATPRVFALHWPLRLWLGGSCLCLLRLALHYQRLLRQSQRLPDSMRQALAEQLGAGELQRLRLHADGPAVLWAPRSRVLLPADFLTRFDAREQQLVLQHEFTHLRRGDALWSVLAELAAALLWFHPLAWLALPRLRLDQELACDERVLRHSPQDEASYAHTLLHSIGMQAMPMFIPWLTQPQLKERLHMIQRPRPGTLRRRSGFIALALAMASTACITQAASSYGQQAPATDQGMNTVTQRSPIYPADAIKRKQQGTVVLLVLISPDGKPLKAKVEPATKAAPDLIQAATDSVMTWRFDPATRNGKPTEAYARVPITFSLDPTPPVAAPPPPPPPNSSNF